MTDALLILGVILGALWFSVPARLPHGVVPTGEPVDPRGGQVIVESRTARAEAAELRAWEIIDEGRRLLESNELARAGEQGIR
jgi:hypothetical protein